MGSISGCRTRSNARISRRVSDGVGVSPLEERPCDDGRADLVASSSRSLDSPVTWLVEGVGEVWSLPFSVPGGVSPFPFFLRSPALLGEEWEASASAEAPRFAVPLGETSCLPPFPWAASLFSSHRRDFRWRPPSGLALGAFLFTGEISSASSSNREMLGGLLSQGEELEASDSPSLALLLLDSGVRALTSSLPFLVVQLSLPGPARSRVVPLLALSCERYWPLVSLDWLRLLPPGVPGERSSGPSTVASRCPGVPVTRCPEPRCPASR